MLTTIEIEIGISAVIGGIVLIVSWFMISNTKNKLYSYIEKNEQMKKDMNQMKDFIKNTFFPAFKEQEQKIKSLELELNSGYVKEPKKVEKSPKELLIEKMQTLMEKGELSKEEFEYMKTINGVENKEKSEPQKRVEVEKDENVDAFINETKASNIESPKKEPDLIDFLKTPRTNSEVAKFLKKSAGDSFVDLKVLVNEGKVKKEGIKYRAV
jgi:hypothetical protein